MTEVTIRFNQKEDALLALRAEDFRDALLEYKEWLESDKSTNASPQEMRAKYLKLMHLYEI